ncbi:MAG TPA: apolipoprotein N-acyltransferase [Stellaceae bacterium]|jgi:apolipoprotein N-acyltransferase|nr:apolipoprotein N-acyltransferase [Stellaceae bacterium]
MSGAKSIAAMLFRATGPLAPLQGWASWTMGLTGWRRQLYAVLMGALAAAALPPIDLTPVLLVSFTSLVWLSDTSRRRGESFLLGWSFGFGFFVAGLYWIGAALLVDIDSFWWLMPFAVLGIPAGLAIFTGAAVLAAMEVRRALALRGTARILALAIAWCVAEWLRGHILTGFPWNLIGYAWSGAFPGSDAMLQITSLIGIYGLSLITVIAASLPARLGDSDRHRPWAGLAAVLLIAVPMVGGGLRLLLARPDFVPSVTIRLVQPSIPESLKNDPAARLDNLRRLIALSVTKSEVPIAAVVWPEGSAPAFLEREDDLRKTLALTMPSGALLMAGDVRTDAAPATPKHIWNSLIVIGPAGNVVGSYDKSHLVPFGEYVPLRRILPMHKITGGMMDFSAGVGPRTLSLPDLPAVGPLVCYEAIFPGAVVQPGHRPGWLLNITNDAWYGVTSGPFQHFAIARVRAAEEGLPLLRDANNGITGAIDPYGRVLRRLDLDAIGVLDVPLPAALAPTVYSRIGDLGFLVLLIITMIVSVAIAGKQPAN